MDGLRLDFRSFSAPFHSSHGVLREHARNARGGFTACSARARGTLVLCHGVVAEQSRKLGESRRNLGKVGKSARSGRHSFDGGFFSIRCFMSARSVLWLFDLVKHHARTRVARNRVSQITRATRRWKCDNPSRWSEIQIAVFERH